MLEHKKPENGLLNILFNIIVPVLILNKLSHWLGPLPALVLALSFPLGYGIVDYLKRKKTNYFSLLGLLNVAITGGFALAGLTGIWFAIKEAIFPLLIGFFVFASAFTKQPFIQTLFMNPQLMKMDLLWQKLNEQKSEAAFEKHLRFCTKLLSISFLVSAALNYYLAQKIFLPLGPELDATAQSLAINQQIAEMTSKSMLVILLPSVVMLIGVFWYLLKGIEKFTQLKIEEFLNQ